MATETKPTSFKRFPGIQNFAAKAICSTPDGSDVFSFDADKFSFVKINSATGATILLQTELPIDVHGKMKCEWYPSIHASLRSSKLFILSMFREEVTNKIYVLSFLFTDNKLRAVNELFTGIAQPTFEYPTFSLSNGRIYVTFYSREQDKNFGFQTTVNVLNVDVSGKGTLSCKILTNQLRIPGDWFDPFIYLDASYWFPNEQGFLKNFCKIHKVPFEGENADMSITIKHIGDWRWKRIEYAFRSTNLTVVGHEIFFYGYKESSTIGALFILNWKEKCWRKVCIEMKDHTVAYWPIIDLSENGLLFLHGKCSAPVQYCGEYTHLYVINAKNLFQVRYFLYGFQF